MPASNPLLEAVVDYLLQGKQFTAISPDLIETSKREVRFSFSDGTGEARTFQCDHATFMDWWKQTTSYLRYAASAANAFAAVPDAEPAAAADRRGVTAFPGIRLPSPAGC